MKYVYFFGEGKAEGSKEMKDLLGGKGANLAEMSSIGVPVPPGFTISTEVCELYYDNKSRSPSRWPAEVEKNLESAREAHGQELGQADDPLLVSVRSGAAISMPGMMDTVLNLGINDKAVKGLADKSGNPRFAWDAYRRFINMFGDVVMGVGTSTSRRHSTRSRSAARSSSTPSSTPTTCRRRGSVQGSLQEAHEAELPAGSAQAALGGGQRGLRLVEQRARDLVPTNQRHQGPEGYRRHRAVDGLRNLGDDSGTGVAFSRDPSTGKKVFYGEYLMNAQGEDVVAGIRTPMVLKTLQKKDPKIYKQLVDVKDGSRRTTRTCRTWSLLSSRVVSISCRPETGSAPVPPRSRSPSTW